MNESEIIKIKIAEEYEHLYFMNDDLADNVCELFKAKLSQIKPQFKELFLSHFREHFENLMGKNLTDEELKTLIILHLLPKKMIDLLD